MRFTHRAVLALLLLAADLPAHVAAQEGEARRLAVVLSRRRYPIDC